MTTLKGGIKMEQTLPMGNTPKVEPKPKGASQKLMVRQFVQDATAEMNLTFDDRIKTLLRAKKSDLSIEDRALVKELKSKVKAKLLEGFNNGTISLSPNSKTTPSKYCSGLLSNWIRKDDFFSVGQQ